jgi:hypothetical protein
MASRFGLTVQQLSGSSLVILGQASQLTSSRFKAGNVGYEFRVPTWLPSQQLSQAIRAYSMTVN